MADLKAQLLDLLASDPDIQRALDAYLRRLIIDTIVEDIRTNGPVRTAIGTVAPSSLRGSLDRSELDRSFQETQ